MPRDTTGPGAHLDVEGPGGCDDFKEVVPHQEVARNRKRHSLSRNHCGWKVIGFIQGETLDLIGVLRRLQLPTDLQLHTHSQLLLCAGNPPLQTHSRATRTEHYPDLTRHSWVLQTSFRRMERKGSLSCGDKRRC